MLYNCEQVIEECARIVVSLLARCPRLALLATSREPLAINGVVVLRVPALSLPDEAEPVDRTKLLHYDALRLFVERAQAADPSFHLTDGNAAVVAEICRHLDGLPLALDPAAVRTRGLGVARLSAGLDQRFQLLTGGDRTALPSANTACHDRLELSPLARSRAGCVAPTWHLWWSIRACSSGKRLWRSRERPGRSGHHPA